MSLNVCLGHPWPQQPAVLSQGALGIPLSSLPTPVPLTVHFPVCMDAHWWGGVGGGSGSPFLAFGQSFMGVSSGHQWHSGFRAWVTETRHTLALFVNTRLYKRAPHCKEALWADLRGRPCTLEFSARSRDLRGMLRRLHPSTAGVTLARSWDSGAHRPFLCA